MNSFTEWLALETKEQRTIYYHGTGSQLLSTILSQGIIPFPKQRSWNSDPDAGFNRPTRQSIGGTYVTTNLMTAKSSAWRAAKKNNSKFNELIVIMDIHPYSLVGDEDDYIGVSSIAVPNSLTTEYSVSGVYFPWKVLNTPKLLTIKQSQQYGEEWIQSSKIYVQKAIDAYVQQALRHIGYKIELKEIHPSLLNRIKLLLINDGFGKAIERQIAYVPSYDYKRFCSDQWEDKCPPEMIQPNKHETEMAWQQFLDQITKTIKKTAYPNSRKSDFNNTARILNPVGFHGKNKIVCIIEVLPYNNTTKQTNVIIHYGTPPQKLISDWETHEGKWVPIDHKQIDAEY